VSTPTAAAERIRFGVYELDLGSLELTKSGMPLKLQPQPSRVLALLARKAGTLVTREEIRDCVWGTDTFVDVDKGLGFCLKKVRAVLGDNARTPHFIETLPRRGYRFIYPVESATKVLHWSSHQEPRQELVLAVLPFGNLSGDASQEYFADGMTETLIIELARISAIRVISRTSVMQYKGLSRPLPQIARDLHANIILEGAVVRSGRRVRITARLIDAATDRHVWADSYERELQDILDLQSEVARAIASEIRVKLTPEEEKRLATTRTVNPAAYENYLKGRFYWNKRTPSALRKSIDYFKQAITQDPSSARAYAGLADSYLVLGFYEADKVPPRVFFSKAKEAARQALLIDGNLAEAHTSLAQLKFTYDWDRQGAELEFTEAVHLNAGYANARHWHALCLAAIGKTAEAKAEIRQALHLDPLSPSIGTSAALCYYWSREYDAALDQCRKLIGSNRSYMMAHMVCALAHEQKGMFDASIAEFKKARNSSDNPAVLGGLGHAYAVSRQIAMAEDILEELKSRATTTYVSPYALALIYLGLGDYQSALSLLAAAYRDRAGWLVYIDVEPRFDILREQPQFRELREQLRTGSHSSDSRAQA
jgi:TolB-like protein